MQEKIGMHIDKDGYLLFFVYKENGLIVSRCNDNTVWYAQFENIEILKSDFENPDDFEDQFRQIVEFMAKYNIKK